MSDASTGPFCEIRGFVERDIDLWLAEELRVNDLFALWFCDHARPSSQLPCSAVLRTRVSVMTENGETDVEAIFLTSDGRKLALLVENKVEHSLTEDQLERYYARGRYGVNHGLWNDFRVIVFAPASKLSSYENLIRNTPTVSFEDAAAFISKSSLDRRATYRAQFLDRASVRHELESEGSDAFRLAFWKGLFEDVERRYPNYFSFPIRYPKTTYIAANPIGAPKYFRIDLKGNLGEVDLSFNNENPLPLMTFLESKMPDSVAVVFKRRSIALQITGLPKFHVADGVEAIDKALQAFAAAYELSEFWKVHRTFFDNHYETS
ncbi:hypothetical protein [Rhodoplanes sp. Z2-YC6860]|uniref:hypothetical protein n=1 Tax=Rhodoplanes sp. Z2-YC6860 TaxID=674703 RepID=UPI00078BE34C|nr:hypothetical protein [Rhodoplanes sp. Z2-YC6860]AMN39057.1 hypothetical protein RHPLAN_05920 [Rhodoplanes sp. Z2-YC6860]